MSFADIRAGVVGVGFIGLAHVEALRRLGVDVRGVVGSSPERARAKAESSALPRVYDNLDELLADPEIDVVHVASPNHVHYDQVKQVLGASKHVVCEKPLALDSTQTADLVSTAKAAGLINAVCFNLRFYPLCHQMRAMIAQGTIGEPRFLTGAYLQDWLLLETDWNWRLVPSQAGELRAVADIGSHWLDLAGFISGRRIIEVIAELHTFVPTRRHPPGPVESFAVVSTNEELIEESMSSDDAASVMLRFEGGARGLVAISQVAAGRRNSITLEVDGSESALAWSSADPEQLWIGHRGRPNELLARDPALVDETARRIIGYPGGHVEGYPDTFRALFGEVYRHIQDPSGDATYPTFADGHEVLLVTEAIAQSHRTQTWTNVKRSET
ncbi:Gfo/Idh/MocA family oxidoreductase [soil metagenome]